MVFDFPCRFCSKTIRSPSSAVGTHVTCGSCSRLVRVPAPRLPYPPASSPLTRGTIEVRISSRVTPSWPEFCACCGKAEETKVPVVNKKITDIVKQAGHLVPSCNLCRKHQEAGAALDPNAIGCLAGVLIVAYISFMALSANRPFRIPEMADVYYMCLILVAWVILYVFIWSKN
jgi:hypothetical protein